jgi:UDP-N-acetylmuramoyl-L-alanyl-D-glutamate--2,6-diaminopimelate ligase
MVKKIIKKIVPETLIRGYHYSWALFSALYYRFPSKRIKVIGVTGTNGKSTTVKLISKILNEADKKVGVVSSIDFELDGKREKNTLKMTMPGRGFLQKFLRRAVNQNCEVVVLEVTSEGIKQFRHKFINFDIALVTNLAPEHIESHGSFEAYKKAKGKLFLEAKKIHILNNDDQYRDYFNSFTAEKKHGYGLKEENTDFSTFTHGEQVKIEEDGIKFSVNNKDFKINLSGKFNVYNSLAAISVAEELGIDLKTASKALKKVKAVPGRMEKIINEPFTVYLDYAFTPNALRQVYKSLKEKEKPKKLIAVLGACGGGRDKWKRPVLGEIASNFANQVIITNEDPYDEDPEQIIREVAAGCQNKPIQITDRREAINKALELAEKGDLVVITGKGAESWIQVKNEKKIPWSDKKVIKEEFKNIYN